MLLPVSFQGTLDSVVDSFMRVHPDIQDSREQVAKTIRTKAEDMRILPLLSLPITLPTGSPAQFNWFKGDTIEAAVRHFATVHRLDASAASLLNKHAGVLCAPSPAEG